MVVLVPEVVVEESVVVDPPLLVVGHSVMSQKVVSGPYSTS